MTNYSGLNTSSNSQKERWNLLTAYASNFSNESLRTLHSDVMKVSNNGADPCTDCVVSTTAIAALFHGQQAEGIMRGLNCTSNMAITIENQKQQVKVRVINLSLGPAICTFTPSQIPIINGQVGGISHLNTLNYKICTKFSTYVKSILTTTAKNPIALASDYEKKPFDFNRISFEKLV